MRTRRRAASSNLCLAIIAVFDNWAARAERLARATDFAPVPDQVDVKRIELTGRHKFVHDLMRARIRTLLRDQPDAPQHAKDVRVERKDIFATGEQERTRDGLWPRAANMLKISD